MKKLLLSALAILTMGSVALAQETVTLKANDADGVKGEFTEEKPKTDSDNGQAAHWQPLESLVINGYTFSFSKAEGTNDPALYLPFGTTTDKNIRVYKKNTMTITAPEGVTISSLAATGKKVPADLNSYADGLGTGTVVWTNNSGENVQFFTLTLTLNGDVPEPVEPTLPEGVVYQGLLETDTRCDWSFVNVVLPEGVNDIFSWKSYKEAYYLNASAYGGTGDSEAYAISPVIDLTDAVVTTVSFDHAARFQTTLKELCGFCVREQGENNWTALGITTWPEAGAWNFANSGDIDLSAYSGKKIELAFKYGSDENGADTWEVKNVVIKGETGAVATITTDANAPVEYFNLQGMRIANPENGIFVRRQGKNVTKVIIRK